MIPAKTICARACTAWPTSHFVYFKEGQTVPDHCPECGKPWKPEPVVHDPRHRDLLAKQREAA